MTFSSLALTRLFSRFSVLGLMFALALCAAPAFAAGPYTIGSSNEAIADPNVPRPATTPCVVTLFSALEFADFNSKTFSYTPPAACPGPWAKVVFTADVNVTAGVQYDRTASFWLGGSNIYFGTTAEPGSNLGPNWHVEKDMTEYSPLFNSAQSGLADIGNLVDQTYTGVIYATANLYFYPLASGQAAPHTADSVLALSAGPTGENVILNTSTDQLAATFTLPLNVERAYLDVYTQSQSGDEFWYTCVPNDVSAELFSCGNTGFREAQISIDGTPAGVAPVFPWIFTGGIDPYLWFPTPGVQTLNFKPFRVDLTPFAGVLSNGAPHQVAVSVYNANGYFAANANLLLYLDHGSSIVTGAITSNTLASPNPVVTEHLSTDQYGDLGGTVSVVSNRSFSITGYTIGSHGRVDTKVYQQENFSNYQHFEITSSLYQQDITQSTNVSTRTTRNGNGQSVSDTVVYNFPLIVDISEPFNSDGSFSLITNIQQEYDRNVTDTVNGSTVFSSFLSDRVTPTDTLLFDSSGNLTGNQNQSNTQSYNYNDSRGECYNVTLAVANNTLSQVQRAGCNDKATK